MSAHPVSLLVSTRNRPAFVEAAVESVQRGDDVPAEIVVVDQSDGPHPRLAAGTSATRVPVRYRWTRTRGLSRGRNEAITAARHDVLAFIDDDVLVRHDWFGALRSAYDGAPPRSIVMGQVLAGEPERPGAFAPAVGPVSEPAVYRGRIGQDVLTPHCMMVPRRAFEEVGLFDERLGAGSRFPSSEDNDFGYRLLEAGFQIVVAPDAVVYHRAWREPRRWVPLRFDYGRGQGAYFAKHLSRRDPYMFERLRRDVVRHARRVPRRLFRDPRGAAGDLAYASAIVLGAVEWLVLVRGPASARGGDTR